jgi:hypothetical protein
MSDNFEKDPRKKQEIRCRPFADDIYKRVFGDLVQIIRDTDIVLDKEFAIDVRLILSNGMNLLGQEKFLSQHYAKYRSVTVEYYQNQFTKEPGDWFKIGVQIYFVGYEIADGFLPFVLLDWTKVTLATLQNKLEWHHNKNNDGRAKASFVWTKMDDIPDNCIIARKL